MDRTLAAAVRDKRTVADDGRLLQELPDGMRIQRSTPITDDRGSLYEVFNRRWNFDDLPLEHVYIWTVRPGTVKGWALHKEHEDRYFLLFGEIQVVLYDVRPESSTYGKVFKVTLSEHDRKLVSIPAFVWHADHNVGAKEAVAINLPTKAYDNQNPDKYRLPLDTPLIPYSFGNAKGW